MWYVQKKCDVANQIVVCDIRIVVLVQYQHDILVTYFDVYCLVIYSRYLIMILCEFVMKLWGTF